MQLEQIRDKAYSDAIRRVPNPSFGASIHEYGETEQEVLKSAGSAVSVVSGDAWSMDVRFGDMVYRLRLSGVVKLENPIMEDVTMNADPNDAALLLAMIQDIHIPSEDILDKSLQLYKWHQVIEVSALHLIEDVLKEHNCGCSIHICGKDRLKLSAAPLPTTAEALQ